MRLLVELVVPFMAAVAVCLDIRFCREPLGMQSGLIPDSALTATSAFDVPSVGPQHARLHVDRNGGAWCPKRQISENVREYLEIDLGTTTVVSGIATQGRYGNGRGQEYAETFRLEYWRQDLNLWRPYKKLDNNEILEGNGDTTTLVHHELRPAVMATKLRVIPYGVYPRTVCMRVEIYGCNRTDGVAWYSAPRGSSWSTWLSFHDVTYDGVLERNTWSRGLGMLTDGYYGLDNFRLDLGAGRGHGWLGWKNDSLAGLTSVPLIFHFQQMRNFSAVYIHANNYISRNVQVFSEATLRFSLANGTFLSRAVSYGYMPDDVLERARNVSIRIPHVCATTVHMELRFAAQWIMISEVTFQSETVTGNWREATETPTATEQINPRETTPVTEDQLGVLNSGSPEVNRGYFEAVVGALSAVMLLLIVVILVIVFVDHHRKTMQPSLVNFALPFNQEKRSNTPEKMPDLQRLSAEYQVPNAAEVGANHATSTGQATLSRFTTEQARSAYSVKFSSLRAASHLEPGQNVLNLGNYFPRMATDPLRRRSHTKSSATHFDWNIRPLVGSTTSSSDADLSPVTEIARSSLKFVEWIGSTAMGEAYICHVTDADPDPVSAAPVLVRGGLLKDPSQFHKEARLLESLKHENLCALLSCCTSHNSGWMIFEYPIYGDLHGYLKRHDVSLQAALKMADQIATAVKYLEESSLYHRDLAARNCLVGRELQIKLGDWAIVSTAFQEDYGEVRGRKPLPLRWLPWETLVLDKFNAASSVWMLGVTVWEILSNAWERPYHTLTDTQVILNADHYYYRDGKHVLLTQPANCPPQLYGWLHSCWSRDETERPSISQSVLILRQMNSPNLQ